MVAQKEKHKTSFMYQNTKKFSQDTSEFTNWKHKSIIF